MIGTGHLEQQLPDLGDVNLFDLARIAKISHRTLVRAKAEAFHIQRGG